MAFKRQLAIDNQALHLYFKLRYIFQCKVEDVKKKKPCFLISIGTKASTSKFSPTYGVSTYEVNTYEQKNPWPPQVELNKRFNNIALSIWGAPSELFNYLMATVQLGEQHTLDKAPKLSINITGAYKCREGLINFLQIGNSVNGTYNWSGGGITVGQMVENEYIGNLTDRGGAGDFKYIFSSDRKSFQMDWRLTG